MEFLEMEWYWWVVIIIAIIVVIPIKVKFMKWLTKREHDKKQEKRDKWGDSE